MMTISNTYTKKTVVLCFSGHDPSGGAGLQADIEAIAANGSHALTVITALTCQDSSRVHSFVPVDARQLQMQADVLLNDIAIDAIKIGMTASTGVIRAIHNIIKQLPNIPVILDPVLASGGGDALAGENLIDAINTYLLPYCRLVTPNIPEALKLANDPGSADTDKAAKKLLASGCDQVLITGTHSENAMIEHRLYAADQTPVLFNNTRLTDEYHGSGCTLASSIAAFIAQGKSTRDATQLGLNYTFQSLQHSHAPGHGQRFPNRFYKLNNHD